MEPVAQRAVSESSVSFSFFFSLHTKKKSQQTKCLQFPFVAVQGASLFFFFSFFYIIFRKARMGP